jgi:hypothetical protein
MIFAVILLLTGLLAIVSSSGGGGGGGGGGSSMSRFSFINIRRVYLKVSGLAAWREN